MCTRAFKRGLTPSTTRLIATTRNVVVMFIQAYGRYVYNIKRIAARRRGDSGIFVIFVIVV